MADSKCSHIPTCQLYPHFSLKGALRIWQDRYCNHPEQHKMCVRFVRSNKGESVPATLLPNGESIPT